MSHFTKLAKANITDPEAFAKAAEELGYKTSRNATASCYRGRNKIEGEVVVHVIEGDDIALTKNDKGSYDMQADWSYMGGEMIRGTSFKSIGELQDRLLQLTTKNTIVEKYRREGWRAHVTEQGGDLNVQLQKYE